MTPETPIRGNGYHCRDKPVNREKFPKIMRQDINGHQTASPPSYPLRSQQGSVEPANDKREALGEAFAVCKVGTTLNPSPLAR